MKVIIPTGSILDPSEGAAVVGGNVLTSQRIVDVVLKAFQVIIIYKLGLGQVFVYSAVHIHTHTHTYTHKHTHIRIHTITRTNTYTHTQTHPHNHTDT